MTQVLPRYLILSIHVIKSWKDALAQNEDPVAIVMSSGYQLWALWANKYKSNKLIEMLVKNLMQRQTGDGSWVSPNPGRQWNIILFLLQHLR